MVKLTVAGILGCARFERARHIALRLKKRASLDLELVPLFESQFEAYMQEKVKSVGSYYFTHTGSPVVTLDDSEYIGGAEELAKWAYVRYHDNDVRTMEDYADLAQTSRVESFVLLPNMYVHFQFAIGCSRATFEMTVELFTDLCPKACLNIVHLCHGDRKDQAGKVMSYIHSEITRVVTDRFLVFGKKQTIYGEYTPDECYELKHSTAGLIGVTNEGRNQHTSQIYVTLSELPSFDRKFQIVGSVVEGLKELRQASELPTKSEKPVQRVYITQSGLMPANPRNLSFPLKVALKEKLAKKIASEIVIPEILETPRPNFESQSYQLIRSKTSKAVKSKVKLPTLVDFLWRTLAPRRAVKIVATLGPSCSNIADIIRMLDVGMNVARIKLGTLTSPETLDLIDKIREANRQRQERACAIMLELEGGRNRVGKFKKDSSIYVEDGAKITLCDDQSKTGNQMRVIVTHIEKDHPEGTEVSLGPVKCRVSKYGKSGLHLNIVKGGEIAQYMKVEFAGETKYAFTETDVNAITTLAGPKEVDFLLLNFIQSGKDITAVREVLTSHNIRLKLIVRLSTLAALQNCEEIIFRSDGVMFCRGDLVGKIPDSKMFVVEQRMLTICKAYGKVAIAGMPLLESLETMSKPIRADCLNAASFVLDGYDALLLGKSTATGQNHVSSVQYLSRLCCEGEKFHKRDFPSLKDSDSSDWLASRAIQSASTSKAAAILVFAGGENEAAAFSKRPLPCPVLVFTTDKLAAGFMMLMRGITGVHLQISDREAGLLSAMSEVRRRSLVSTGEQVVFVNYRNKGEEEMMVIEVMAVQTTAPSVDE